MTLLLACVVPSATSASTPAADRLDPTHEEQLEFIGFSRHEDAAAWRVKVIRPTDQGGFDRFTVIRLVDTKTGEIIGHVRQGKARRTDTLGRRERLSPAERIASENPMWLHALPAKFWKKTRRKVRFSSKPVKVEDGAIRFIADEDADMTISVEDDEKMLVVRSDPGSPIGLLPTARLYDGARIPLGHVRVRGVPGREVNAKIRMYHSPSGFHVAYVVELESDSPGHEHRMDFGRVYRMPGRRLGVLSIGT
ncbi:MAG: hypothetical protein AAF658_16155, partial [Myxococcota bacterium]